MKFAPSVAQLALALPGGDPLAAALAAGETPSPEMVAAAGSKEGLHPAVAWCILAFILAGTIAIMAMNDRFMLHRRIPFKNSPEVLADRSKQFLNKLGFAEESVYRVYGFVENFDFLSYVGRSDKRSDRWKNLGAKAILFWYRQSPRPLVPTISVQDLNAAEHYPPLQFPGEVEVILDTEGHLVSLHAVPPEVQLSPGTLSAPNWAPLFAEAGLDPAQWMPVDSQWKPLFYADTIAAWQGSILNRSGVPVRIEAAAFQGKPVHFEIKDTWTPTTQGESTRQPMRFQVARLGEMLVLFPAILAGLFFARRNLRLGRGDRRNANRLALLVLGLCILATVFSVVSPVPWIPLLLSPYRAGLIWILYIAVEPYVRRKWPQVLISWTRLISGEWRDPLIARDALIGCASGVLLNCILRLAHYLVPSWLGYSEIFQPSSPNFAAIAGPRFFVSQLLGTIISGTVFFCLLEICFFFLLWVLLRNRVVAIAVYILINALWGGPGNFTWDFAVWLIFGAILVFVLMRFGLVAFGLGAFVRDISSKFPATLDTSAWYAGYGYAALAILAVIVLYAFRTSLGGRPLLASSRLDD